MLSKLIKKELVNILDPKRVLDRKENLYSYAYDAFVEEALPRAVLFPRSRTEVSGILEIANREGLPVTSRGAGTSLCGAPVPLHQAIVLCFINMNQILEINTQDRYSVVQPGVVNGELQKELSKEGFFYPPDPGSYTVSTIGGNIAMNAGGPRCLKYGVTADYVLSLEVVLASGEIIRCGSRNIKDVTGYNLKSLFCGSEGTLGVITEATLRVMPLPEAYRTVLAVFNNLCDCAISVADIIGSGILPAALELMDNKTINTVEDSARLGLPRQAEGLLIIEVDGNEDGVEKEMERIVDKVAAHGAEEVQKARSQAERDKLWTARRSAYGAMARLAPNCIPEDATVPVSQVPRMIQGMKEIFDRYDLEVGIIAHAGDGNMHPMIATDMNDKGEWNRVEQAVREVFELAVSLGGTLSGEHGIGMGKSDYLGLALNHPTLRIMSEIKQTLDPNGILNPGKFI